MFLVLACALYDNNWWPLFVLMFYFLAPVPLVCSRRVGDSGGMGGSSNGCLDFARFITVCIVVSAYALPIVLAKAPALSPVIQTGACWLVMAGNTVTFLT